MWAVQFVPGVVQVELQYAEVVQGVELEFLQVAEDRDLRECSAMLYKTLQAVCRPYSGRDGALPSCLPA